LPGEKNKKEKEKKRKKKKRKEKEIGYKDELAFPDCSPPSDGKLAKVLSP